MTKRSKLFLFIATGALAIVALVGAVTYRSVYAQAATPTPSTPNGQAAPGPDTAWLGGFGGRHAGNAGYTQQDLATALGITTDQLQAAYTAANSEALKQAVSQGLITQAQADALAARGLPPRFFGGQSGIDYNALLAQALNISTDQLQAAYTKALDTSIDNAVASGSMTQAQADLIKGRSALANNSAFQSAMKTAFEAAVKQAVTGGVITQAQADAILQEQSQTGGGPGSLGGSFGLGGPDGGFSHGRGGPGGPFEQGLNQLPGAAQPNISPTAVPDTNGL